MVPSHRSRLIRLGAAALAEGGVAWARGGFVVRPPAMPPHVAPLERLMYASTFLSVAVFVLVLFGTYLVVALLTFLAEGTFPQRLGPLEMPTQLSGASTEPAEALAERSRESIEVIGLLLRELQRLGASERTARARAAELEDRLAAALEPAHPTASTRLLPSDDYATLSADAEAERSRIERCGP